MANELKAALISAVSTLTAGVIGAAATLAVAYFHIGEKDTARPADQRGVIATIAAGHVIASRLADPTVPLNQVLPQVQPASQQQKPNGNLQVSQVNKEEHVAITPSQPSMLENCSISGQLSVKEVTVRLLSKDAKSFIEAFVNLENSSQDPVSFIQIGPAQFTDSANRQTDSSTTTAAFSKVLPGPGGTALVGVANASERLDAGQSKSFTLDFPAAADTKAQNGELKFELATFTGKNISGAGFATRAESQSVRCVGK